MKKPFIALALAIAFPLLSEPVHAQTAYMVSNAHLDSQWNWDVQTTIREYIPSTIERNLLLLEKFPEYIFNCESGIKYSWMKEYYPKGYEKVKQYIAAGRWHISGSCWEATDANVPSTESLTRNILYGQHFYESEFGVKSTDIFLPDCFGFGYQLPSIARHCGLIGFSTQKLQWRNLPFYGDSKVPFQFGEWYGVDGNSLLAAVECGKYSTKYTGEDLSESKSLLEHAAKSPQNISMHYYGVGDIGGSPTIKSVISLQRGVNGDGPVKVLSATSDQLFLDILDARKNGDSSQGLLDLPTFDGELTMDVHGTGCYTSQAAMKLLNRRNELMADAAERSSVIAEHIGAAAYPAEALKEAWLRVIWHQFHDDLTGTSIPRAYEFSWNDELISLSQFTHILQSSAGAVSSALDTRVRNRALVLFNPSAFDRTDIVTIDGCYRICDEKGKAVTSQCDGSSTSFIARIPALGYIVYDAKPVKVGKPAHKSVRAISNSIYELTLDANGDICSLIDKRCGKQLVEEGKAIRLAIFTENSSATWPAWEILKSTLDSEPEAITGASIELVENGPLQKVLRVERSHSGSTFVQHIILHEGALADRIDIRNEVEWGSMHSLLKAEFPLSVKNPKARYDIGLGSLERGNNLPNMYEVYAQQWAEMAEQDGSYGVAIMNDSKYGWDKPSDSLLRLTLLHTPRTSRSYKYQDHQDLGHHIFTYSIVAHEGDWTSGDIVDKAEALNQPVKAFFAPKHSGALGRKYSFASASDGFSVKAVKKAENGEGYVIRVYETTGKEHSGKLAFSSEISEAQELNGNEEIIGAAAAKGSAMDIEIGAFGVKTFLVKFASRPVEGIRQAIIPLGYSTITTSYNAFRKDVNIDHTGGSYAAELLPSVLDHDGIHHVLQDPTKPNAMRCRGEQIELPEGNWNRVYILAASATEDQRVAFEVGGVQQEVTIPHYTGFIGQWGHTGHTEGYLKNVDVAYVGTHTHCATDDKAYEFGYMFSICLEVPAGARSIKLPENKQVLLFSAVAAQDEVNLVSAAHDLMRTGIPYANDPELGLTHAIALTEKNIIDRSGQVNANESADKLLDDDETTKWCDNSKAPEKFVAFDLGTEREIHGWTVLHATHESSRYTTKDFALEVRNSLDEDWSRVDSVTGNKAPITERHIDMVKARYVRLLITDADQIEANVARIYEFSIF
ncbi:MAG: discoidin domain-containing protein [Bacteroidales bacterium]|nr:discoidin domain-containing protein [Bacteroidales bacterium]